MVGLPEVSALFNIPSKFRSNFSSKASEVPIASTGEQPRVERREEVE